jgi:hypothetical protein
MVSKPILWIAELVGGDKLRVENGTRSYAAGAGAGAGAEAGASSSLTFEELGSETSGSAWAGVSPSDSGPAAVEAFEGLFLFLFVLPPGLGGFEIADMVEVYIEDLSATDNQTKEG